MKVCPFCNAEIPEESVYCLNCASVLNERQVFPAVKEKKRKAIILLPRKKIMSAVAVVLSLVIVISSCLFALHSSRDDTPKTEEKKTTLVPVTEENGESVTDDNGEQVFEVTEITEATTKKQGLLDKLFGKDEDETKDDNTSETTTKKQSLIDKIFGNDEKDEEESSSSATTTEPEATTSAEPSAEATTDKAESSSTSITESTTESTTKEDTTSNINDFEYTELNGKIKITKYTGNASTVTVPAYINGKHVAYLGENAFANNSNIKKIVFTGTTSGTSMFYLPTARTVFNNLPNLTSITFPYETHYRMVDDTETPRNDTFYELLVDCPKVSGIYFTDKVNLDYSSTLKTMYSADGVVCSQTSNDKMYGQPYRDSSLLYYPPAKTDTQYITPIRVKQIEKYAFKNNFHIKSIHFSEAARYIKTNFVGCENLDSFTVDENNAYLFVENDVLYTGGLTINNIVYRGVCYPPAKKDTTFEFTKNCNILLGYESFGGNPYLQTIKCPMATYIDGSLDDVGMPPALNTIMLKEENTNSIQVSKSSFNFVYY